MSTRTSPVELPTPTHSGNSHRDPTVCPVLARIPGAPLRWPRGRATPAAGPGECAGPAGAGRTERSVLTRPGQAHWNGSPAPVLYLRGYLRSPFAGTKPPGHLAVTPAFHSQLAVGGEKEIPTCERTRCLSRARRTVHSSPQGHCPEPADGAAGHPLSTPSPGQGEALRRRA